MAEQRTVAFEDHFAARDRWFENRVYPAADGLSILFHDITVRKRAEQAARDNHEFDRQIIASASEGIAVFDRELRVVQLNAALASMMQLPPEAIIGRRPLEFMPAALAEDGEARLRRALAGEVIETVESTSPAIPQRATDLGVDGQLSDARRRG